MRKLQKTSSIVPGLFKPTATPEPFDVAKNLVLHIRAARVSGPDKHGWITCEPMNFKGETTGETFRVQTRHVIGGPLK